MSSSYSISQHIFQKVRLLYIAQWIPKGMAPSLSESLITPGELGSLSELIKSIESRTNTATSVILTLGHLDVLFGDVTQRRGIYGIDVFPEHSYPLHGNTYPSFEKLKAEMNRVYQENLAGRSQLLKDATTQVERDMVIREYLAGGTGSIFQASGIGPIFLIADDTTQYRPCIVTYGINLGRAGGQTYRGVGKILCPLLMSDEPVAMRVLNTPLSVEPEFDS